MSRLEGSLIANLGDRNPFDHGGYLIFKHGKSYTGVYWDSPDSDDEPTQLYRFAIENDVFADHNWAKPAELASFVGSDASDLIKLGKSRNVLDRAEALRDIGAYHGFDNLDNYPLETTVRQLRKDYGRVVDGLYKRERRR